MHQIKTLPHAAPKYPHVGAFESTKLSGSGTDILGTTRHIECWEADLQLLRSASITQLRYSVPWHRIECEPGTYDFTWLDGPMAYMQAIGMTPVLDPLHHISYPDWLDRGFADPDFPRAYERFVTKVAERYPWVNCYTVFNEPLPTTLFCGFTGWWHPYQASDDCFVRMALNVARAICLSSATLRKSNSQTKFVHVETCETHRSIDNKSEEWTRFANARRFLMHDLILGQVNREHELYGYLRQHGFTEDHMHW